MPNNHILTQNRYCNYFIERSHAKLQNFTGSKVEGSGCFRRSGGANMWAVYCGRKCRGNWDLFRTPKSYVVSFFSVIPI